MKHVELEQFLHAFTSRGFDSVSWAFLLYFFLATCAIDNAEHSPFESTLNSYNIVSYRIRLYFVQMSSRDSVPQSLLSAVYVEVQPSLLCKI